MKSDEIKTRVFLKLIMIPEMGPGRVQTIIDNSNIATLKRIEEILSEYDVNRLDIVLFDNRLQGIAWRDNSHNKYEELIDYIGNIIKHDTIGKED